MSAREFDPLRLDVEAFAKEGARLSGQWPLAGLDRLADVARVSPDGESPAPQAPPQRLVDWDARGEAKPLRGGEVQIWLHLRARVSVPLECQRCLKPVESVVEVQRDFLFVRGEDAAAELDAQTDDDVLALTRALDLRELIEDELLLALPLVPRHEVCPSPLPLASEDPGSDEAAPAPNPFAALAALKRGSRLN